MAGGLKSSKTGTQKPKATDLKAELDQNYPRNLHKELFGREDRRLEETLYRWWWEFMSASKEFPELRQELVTSPDGGPQNAKLIEAMEDDFGDLKAEFKDWWVTTGAELFQEQEVPKIHVFAPKSPDDEEFKRKEGVILQIPMTISRELILEQINLMLDIYHPGADLKRHDASTAKRKIFPKTRYRAANYGELIAFWRIQRENLRLAQPKSLWEVYCTFTGDETLRAGLANRDNMDARIKITKQAEQLYKQADELMRNAVLGQFPKDTEYQKVKHGKAK